MVVFFALCAREKKSTKDMSSAFSAWEKKLLGCQTASDLAEERRGEKFGRIPYEGRRPTRIREREEVLGKTFFPQIGVGVSLGVWKREISRYKYKVALASSHGKKPGC